MKKLTISVFIIAFSYLTLNCGKPIESESQFKIISKCPNPGYAQSIWIDTVNYENYAFVASGHAGMVIYNIAIPESTFIFSQLMDTMNSCWSIATLQKYAYFAYGNKELAIADINNLDSIKFIGEFVWPVAYAYDIFVPDTHYAYIAAKQQFIIAEISNPVYPNVIYQHSFPSDARGIFIKDSFAYIACEQLGIYILNIKSNPIVIVDNCDTPSNARGIFVNDNTCYVADGKNGLVIIDVTNPRTSIIVGQLDLSGYANRLYIKDSLAYVACGEAGLAIVNVNDKTKPVLVQSVKTSYAKGVFVPNGPYIYVADRDEGLVVIKQEE